MCFSSLFSFILRLYDCHGPWTVSTGVCCVTAMLHPATASQPSCSLHFTHIHLSPSLFYFVLFIFPGSFPWTGWCGIWSGPTSRSCNPRGEPSQCCLACVTSSFFYRFYYPFFAPPSFTSPISRALFSLLFVRPAIRYCTARTPY